VHLRGYIVGVKLFGVFLLAVGSLCAQTDRRTGVSAPHFGRTRLGSFATWLLSLAISERSGPSLGTTGHRCFRDEGAGQIVGRQISYKRV
jgi:hypothetical protein